MATPTDKSNGIENLLTALTGKRRRDVIESGLCMTCNGRADNFRDEKSRKEYCISGMCGKCQDNFFGKSNNEE